MKEKPIEEALPKEIIERKREDAAEDSSQVKFGDVADRLGSTTQGAAYYFDGLGGCPELGLGLTILKKELSYHSWRMSKKDADEFVRRVKEQEEKKEKEIQQVLDRFNRTSKQ